VRSPARLAAPVILFLALVAFSAPSSPSPPGGTEGAAALRLDPDEPANDDSEVADEGDEADDHAPSSDGDDHAPSSDGDDDIGPMAERDAGKRRSPRGGCPSSMVRAQDFCVDRYEAPNRRGAKPLVMQSANDAVSWCAEHRKRLCTEDEWIAACEGEEHHAYPYGETHVDGRCNDDKPWRKVDEATLAKWPAPEARDLAKELYQATPSGWKRKCVSGAGARDMTGNTEEWVVRTREHDNDWPYLLVGCYWSGCYGGGKPTCHSTNDAHGPEFRFYETGFRCCRDAKAK
jgi:formylglycine-generating enzyme required for sulfatase activity